MVRRKKIKVLVVDDSLLFREVLKKGLSEDLGIEVIAAVSNPYQARDKIIEYRPDVMTLDIEMPKMNGIKFLQKLMPQYPMPIVVVSSISDRVFDALNAGAVDFVTKPDNKHRSLENFINELIIKIKIASTAKLGNLKRKKQSDVYRLNRNRNRSKEIIAIGASTGGTEAIYNIIKELPGDIPGIVIVQHIPPVFSRMFAERLNNSCILEVKEGKVGDEVIPGKVLIAPGDQHMTISKKGNGYIVRCSYGEKVNGHCPSVDVLFNSVAKEAGDNAIGIILTGMGRDGAKGILNMRKNGAKTLGQDEKSCVVYGMPKAAYEIGGVEKQLPLDSIAKQIYSMTSNWK
ncbi:chemotaxis response regulator protein-glutamate methylesterase [Clostridium aestuarii]|uniref:Protein-glutamate methylesterase/protein-glutamine glutaminase n=1 Tax=Clostridium aestuarii TaxID=338193 RepID=A0ABT4D0P7_9CLOT|nr:chemotaxis response regulator protein-glutamate methylesterase [Clostridium aestuarii]MCY6484814.1 chemotaxis response regulator protein-glutamate methylesterase [Clostridium aestuarii]